jgi:hypothetical protein
VRFDSNRAGSQFMQLSDGQLADDVIIRESVFTSSQPRILIEGGEASIINTIVTGAAGVHG